MKKLVVVAAFALGGCQIASVFQPPAPRSFAAPDGRRGFHLVCGGGFSSMAACYDGARSACLGDYEVINQSVTPRDGTITENRSLDVVCKS